MINRLFNSRCFVGTKLAYLALSLLISSLSFAKDLGVVGKVYPIKETDLLEFIQSRILVMQQNGDWQKLQNQSKDRIAKHIDRPMTLSNVHKTVIAKSWRYDPSISVPYDLKDTEGYVFAKAGTRVNPLSFKKLHTALVFYDGDDVEQVEWVKKINIKFDGKTKLVLANGSIVEQQKIFKQPVYFDQQGRLTTTFHITQIPAVVYQDGMELVIAEVIP